MELVTRIEELAKALEAGSYNAAPSSLVQGAALQIEDLSKTMHNVTWDDKNIKLSKMLKSESCKSTLAQFDRVLSYGIFGGSAQLEGNVGQEETSDFVRAVVPMAYYSHTRRVTIVANDVETVDGVKAEDRAAEHAAKKIAGDIEFDCFRGMADFSNAGVFDGNPLAAARLPNMRGVDIQVRSSDFERETHDLMFNEFGSDDTVVLNGGGPLTQDIIEDASLRSALAFGNADKLMVDPTVLSGYNKIMFGKERYVLGGSPQDSTGADLRQQWTSNATVKLEASQFLRGKSKPAEQRANGPVAPSGNVATSVTDANAVTAFTAGDIYKYFTSAQNEVGESVQCAVGSVTIAATGDKVSLAITGGGGTVRFFNVYRTLAGGIAGTQKFIGRIKANASGNATFIDLGNKSPGFVTGYLVENDSMMFKTLREYSRTKLAMTNLTMPEAHFTFKTLCVTTPRVNCIIDNLSAK